jgi:hypothetical protein
MYDVRTNKYAKLGWRMNTFLKRCNFVNGFLYQISSCPQNSFCLDRINELAATLVAMASVQKCDVQASTKDSGI